jgi:hypothetical protein
MREGAERLSLPFRFLVAGGMARKRIAGGDAGLIERAWALQRIAKMEEVAWGMRRNFIDELRL